MVTVMFISRTEQGCNFQLKIYVTMSPNPSLAMFTKDTVGHKWLIIYESGDFNLRASWFYMVCPISKNASLCRGAICALG